MKFGFGELKDPNYKTVQRIKTNIHLLTSSKHQKGRLDPPVSNEKCV